MVHGRGRDERLNLGPASGKNGSHKALGLKGLGLWYREGFVRLDSSKGTEKLTHRETWLQERGAQSRRA